VLAGAVVGAQFQARPSEEVRSSLRADELLKVADVSAAPGLAARGVFLQPTSAGFLCLWDAPSAASLARQGGCNPADDPLDGERMLISFAYEGGPAIRDVKDARLVGVASLDVATVEVVMSDGSRRDVVTKRTPALAGLTGSYRAFGYRLKTSDLKRGVGPTAVVALDGAGREIDRQVTGFVE